MCHIGTATEFQEEIRNSRLARRGHQFSISGYRRQVVPIFRNALRSKLKQLTDEQESMIFVDVRPACGYFARNLDPVRNLSKSLLHPLSVAARHFQVRHRTRGLAAVIIWSENYVDDDSIPRVRQIICTADKEAGAIRDLLDAFPNASC